MKKFIEFHVVHSVPVSNLNRGQFGEVKTVEVGSALRSRVSSNCWKHEIRKNMDGVYRLVSIGFCEYMKTELIRHSCPEEKIEAIINLIHPLFYKEKHVIDAKSGEIAKNNVIANISASEIDLLIKCFKDMDFEARVPQRDGKSGKKVDQTIKKFYENDILPNVVMEDDLALFGRMLASNTAGCVDGAVNFAHAYSVHEHADEIDYFVASIDKNFNLRDDGGSGHMNSKEFCSSTYYRYFCIDIDKFIENKRGSVNRNSLCEFIKTSLLSTPSGSQNAMAARTLPYFIKMNFYANNKFPTQVIFNNPIPRERTVDIEKKAQEFINSEMERYAKNYGIVADITIDNNIPQMLEVIAANV